MTTSTAIASSPSLHEYEHSTEKNWSISMQEQHKKLIEFLYNSQHQKLNEVFVKIEHKTNIKREFLVYILFGACLIYMIIGSAAQLMCNLVGFGYPAYASVKAIHTSNKDDDTHWLIYWTVFGLFSLIDFFAQSLMHIFPLYFVGKALLLIALHSPQVMGAQHLYTKLVDPAIIALDHAIDKFMADKAA